MPRRLPRRARRGDHNPQYGGRVNGRKATGRSGKVPAIVQRPRARRPQMAPMAPRLLLGTTVFSAGRDRQRVLAESPINPKGQLIRPGFSPPERGAPGSHGGTRWAPSPRYGVPGGRVLAAAGGRWTARGENNLHTPCSCRVGRIEYAGRDATRGNWRKLHVIVSGLDAEMRRICGEQWPETRGFQSYFCRLLCLVLVKWGSVRAAPFLRC